MALAVFIDNLCRHLDQGRSSPLFLLDLTAAFNMVDHDPLTYHLADTAVFWVSLAVAYLISPQMGTEGGARRKDVHEAFTELWSTSRAVLSPVLFNIFMHPLTQLAYSFRLGCHQYTDDTKLYLLMGVGQMLPLGT